MFCPVLSLFTYGKLLAQTSKSRGNKSSVTPNDKPGDSLCLGTIGEMDKPEGSSGAVNGRSLNHS